MIRGRTRHERLLLILLALLLNGAALAADSSLSSNSLDAAAARYTVTTTKPFDDVVADLEFAISENNYRITGRNQIGKAIADSENIAFPRSTIIHFCNLQTAKEVFDLNPDFLLHMPCRITLREKQGDVVIEARLVPENDPKLTGITARINAMLRRIADYAAK